MNPAQLTKRYEAALEEIRTILGSTHPDSFPGEKLVRIEWVILELEPELRETIQGEAKNRVGIAWAIGKENMRPTKF